MSSFNRIHENFYRNQTHETLSKIPPDIYQVKSDLNKGLYLSKYKIDSDNLLDLPNPSFVAVTKEIDIFFNPEVKAKYEKYGYMYRRGILLHGPPGTGKTGLLNRLMKKAILNNFTVITNTTSPYLISSGIKFLRGDREDSQPVMVIVEEFDSLIEDDEYGWLQLLDGSESTPNTVYIATTNYLDRIPLRIRNRPSRFASIIEVNSLTEEARRVYLQHILKDFDNEKLETYIRASEGMLIDQIKDLVISTECIGLSLSDAVIKIKELSKLSDY